MKRIIALLMLVVLLTGVIIVIAGLEQHRKPDWQAALDEYLARQAAESEIWTVQEATAAGKPWNFDKTTARAVLADWRRGIDDLPFPPLAVRCVLLQRSGLSTTEAETEPSRRIVFVGHHSDTLWQIDWLVHEGPRAPFSPELAVRLAAIGCDLSLK